MAYMVVADIVMACITMVFSKVCSSLCSHGLYGYGLYGYGLHSYGCHLARVETNFSKPCSSSGDAVGVKNVPSSVLVPLASARSTLSGYLPLTVELPFAGEEIVPAFGVVEVAVFVVVDVVVLEFVRLPV